MRLSFSLCIVIDRDPASGKGKTRYFLSKLLVYPSASHSKPPMSFGISNALQCPVYPEVQHYQSSSWVNPRNGNF